MYCDEMIEKVYLGVIADDDVYSHYAFLDCYRDIAYHCTEGYRIVLETENYAISLSTKGVIKERKEELREKDGEWLRNGIEIMDDVEPPWVLFETTLFVGEKLLSVVKENGIYVLQFDDFLLKIVPHLRGENINWLHYEDRRSYHYVLGCDRHLKRKCPDCGADGEILMDIVGDYIVRCKNCKRSTWAGMNTIDAIEDWNNGALNCTADDIIID